MLPINSEIQSNTPINRLLSAGLLLGLCILIGRLTGFARDAILAWQYGASNESDVLIFLFSLPDLMLGILAGGAFSAVLVPEFKRLSSDSKLRLIVQTSTAVGVVFGALAVLLLNLREEFVRLLAPGFPAENVAHTVAALPLVLWTLPVTALTGITTAYLQASERFLLAGAGGLIVNACLILGLALASLGYTSSIRHVVSFVFIGAIVRLASQLWPLVSMTRSRSRLPEGRFTLLDRRLVVRYAQAAGAGSMILMLPMVARAIATTQGAGSLSVFNYAIKLVEIPLGVAVTVVSTVLYPRIAESFARERRQDGARLIKLGMLASTAIALCMVFSLAWFSGDIADVFFGHGEMTSIALNDIVEIAAVGFMSLPAQGASTLLVAAFNAKGDTRSPLVISAAGMALFFVGAWWSTVSFGLLGLMTALTSYYWIVALAQAIALKVKHGLSACDKTSAFLAIRLVFFNLFCFCPVALLSALAVPAPWINVALAGFLVLISIAGTVLLCRNYWKALQKPLKDAPA